MKSLSNIFLELDGVVPSKKNAWRRPGNGGKAYLPAQVQADIDALVIQANAKRHSLDLSLIAGHKLKVSAHFMVKKSMKDLDNVFTTLLDVLQKSRIIENDKLVRAFSVEEFVTEGREKVTVTIYPHIG